MALQCVGQEVTELIIARLPDEASTIAQPSHADCHVGWGTTRGFLECRSLSQAHSRFRRDKVNEHLTTGDYIHHSSLQWSFPPFLGPDWRLGNICVLTPSPRLTILIAPGKSS